MKFVIPENVGSSLRVLPVDTYETQIQDIYLGESKEKKPKATIKFVTQSEYTGPRDKDFQSCVGETIIETVSLQAQAIWKLNDYFKGATGERLPQGEFDEEEMLNMLKEGLVGSRWNLLVETDTSQGDERTKVKKATPIKGKSVGGQKIRR
jgi:hypothetical protein